MYQLIFMFFGMYDSVKLNKLTVISTRLDYSGFLLLLTSVDYEGLKKSFLT